MLNLWCISCGEKMKFQGGLVLCLKTPDEPAINRGSYLKYHVCMLCWDKTLDRIASVIRNS